MIRALDRASLKWVPHKLRPSSVWVSQLPLKDKGFALNSDQFRDGLALRYGYDPPNAPQVCSCDDTTPWTRSHVFGYSRKGGHQTKRHDAVQRVLGNIAATRPSPRGFGVLETSGTLTPRTLPIADSGLTSRLTGSTLDLRSALCCLSLGLLTLSAAPMSPGERLESTWHSMSGRKTTNTYKRPKSGVFYSCLRFGGRMVLRVSPSLNSLTSWPHDSQLDGKSLGKLRSFELGYSADFLSQ